MEVIGHSQVTQGSTAEETWPLEEQVGLEVRVLVGLKVPSGTGTSGKRVLKTPLSSPFKHI